MNPDVMLPIVLSIGWLVLAVAGLASYRLNWGRAIKMAIVWVVIFLGLFLTVKWFLMARDTAGTML